MGRHRRFPATPEGQGLSTISLEIAGARFDAGEVKRAETAQAAGSARSVSSSRGHRGLDWFVFFLADIQTGFGPFIAIYLTTQQWTQVDIGLVLTAGGLFALAGQMPGGALVDAARSSRLLAALAVVAICFSAMALALWPIFLVVVGTRALHAGASCILGPVIVAISLGVAGHGRLGERLGRNARFASIGNGVAAAAMGACGYLISNQAVFFLTAALVVPALLALGQIRKTDIERSANDVGEQAGHPTMRLRDLASDHRLLIFAGCILLFQLANAAMLPLMGSILTLRSPEWAAALIGACIVLPQLFVAAFAPWVGRLADSWGRRPLLFLCFAALAIRGLMFALSSSPYLVVAVQILDGVSAAVLGVTLPLVVADITRGTGRFNLALGIVGTAVGIGAALSTTFAGYAMDHFGSAVAFVSLAAVALCGLAVVWRMPETRPPVA